LVEVFFLGHEGEPTASSSCRFGQLFNLKAVGFYLVFDVGAQVGDALPDGCRFRCA
jgi:hypothetical protein